MKLTEQTVFIRDKKEFYISKTAYVLTRDQLEQLFKDLLDKAAEAADFDHLYITVKIIDRKSITGVLPEFLTETLC